MVNLLTREAATSAVYLWLARKWNVREPGEGGLCVTGSSMRDLESIWEWKKWHRCRHQEITQFSTNYTIQQLVS